MHVQLWCLAACILGVFGQKNLKVSTLHSEYGYTVLQLEKFPVLENYIKLLHIIDVNKFEIILYKTSFEMESFNKKIDGKFSFIMDEIEKSLDKIQFIKGISSNTKKHKRAAVGNIFGNLFNFNFGKMDDEDIKEVKQKLEELKYNMKSITENSASQVKINDNFSKSIENVTNSLKETQTTLERTLNTINDTTDRLNQTQKAILIGIRVHAEVVTMSQHLDKIIDTIIMSQSGMIPHDILTTEEKESYNITVNMLPFLRLGSLMMDGKIIFVINIPNISQQTYYEAIIIPVPNDQNMEIWYDRKNVLIHGDEVYEHPGKICKRKNLKLVTDSCQRNVLKKNNLCRMRLNNITSSEEIIDGIIIAKNLPLIEVNQNCEKREVQLKGNVLIAFKNCSVTLLDSIFTNYEAQYEETFVISPIHENFTKLHERTQLENVHMNTKNNREKLENLELRNNFTTWGLICAIFAVFGIFFVLGCIVYKKVFGMPTSRSVRIQGGYYFKP